MEAAKKFFFLMARPLGGGGGGGKGLANREKKFEALKINSKKSWPLSSRVGHLKKNFSWFPIEFHD